MDFTKKIKKASKRVTKEEKYDFAVMTVGSKPEKGHANKITFNKAAVELLGFKEGGCIGFVMEDDIFACKPGINVYTVAKTNASISNKDFIEVSLTPNIFFKSATQTPLLDFTYFKTAHLSKYFIPFSLSPDLI